jgi:predicted O-methyltransferase YrrM
MISLHSLKMRLRMIRSLAIQRTNGWVDELSSHLETVGFRYKGVLANRTPLDFLMRLSERIKPVSMKRLDYSRLASHDFYIGKDDFDHQCNSEPEVAQFVGDVAYNLSSQNVLETGCFVGFGSAHLATALCELGPNRNLFIVDESKKYLEITRQNLHRLDLDRVAMHLHEGKTWDQKILLAIPNNLDVIFLDADHMYEGIKKELDGYLPKLAPDGVAMVHDSILWPGVRRAIVELPARYDRMTFGTSRGNGVSVIMHAD